MSWEGGECLFLPSSSPSQEIGESVGTQNTKESETIRLWTQLNVFLQGRPFISCHATLPLNLFCQLQALSDTVTGGYCDYIGYCDYLADSRSQMPYFILMPYLILWLYHIGYCDYFSSKFGAKVPYFYNILPICRYIFLLNHQTWFKNANKHQNYWIKVTPSFL